jgi:hypothetical protein
MINMKKRNYVVHDFYCIGCRNKGIPLARNTGFQHGKMHRKKLFCLHCKCEINHVECKTYADVEKFKEDFENGVYKNEAEESISFIRNSGLREVYVGT